MPGWHRADIIAALRKQGLTLTALGQANGKAASSLSAALLKPSRGCNQIIANKIGVPLHELWPEWFNTSGCLIVDKPTTSERRRSSQNRGEKLTLTRRRA